MARSPTMAEVLQSALDCRLADLHTSMPGRIDAYDVATQTADVTPLIKRRERDPDGNEDIQELPSINSVPVVFQRGGNSFVSLPIAVGDTVLLVFCESDIEQWQFTAELSSPDDLRRHDLSDAVAIAGLYAEPDAIQNLDPDNEGITIGFDSANGARIYIAEDKIELGEKDSADKAVLDSSLQTELAALKATVDALVTAYNAHIHVTTATVGATATPGVIIQTVAQAAPHGPIGPTASTLVTIKE